MDVGAVDGRRAGCETVGENDGWGVRMANALWARLLAELLEVDEVIRVEEDAPLQMALDELLRRPTPPVSLPPCEPVSHPPCEPVSHSTTGVEVDVRGDSSGG